MEDKVYIEIDMAGYDESDRKLMLDDLLKNAIGSQFAPKVVSEKSLSEDCNATVLQLRYQLDMMKSQVKMATDIEAFKGKLAQQLDKDILRLAETKAGIEIWERVLGLILSGTPIDGIKTIAEQNLRGLRELEKLKQKGKTDNG